ncbi:hypothetical protein VW35_02360 [Devosia soli]|uniref:Chromosomal replication initiator DnaA C-terminal domain-containing protein n=2 Tax=Devosia soli TaxID=361041 RepID=A0A0F5LF89_9HYPH|nr:hypothetical protein VW35_02360 [Devosia soli]
MLRACSWRFLVEYAALAGGVDASDILGSNRTREVVDARHHALVLTYQHTQASLPAIGRLFGKDHSTVCYAMNKYNARGKLVDLFEGTRALLRPNSGRKLPLRVDDPHTPRTALQKAVARAYKNGVPTRVLVEELGTTSNAVNVMAHRLGLRRKPLDGGAG